MAMLLAIARTGPNPQTGIEGLLYPALLLAGILVVMAAVWFATSRRRVETTTEAVRPSLRKVA